MEIIIIESIILAAFGMCIINMSRRIKQLEATRVNLKKLEERIQLQNAGIFNALMDRMDKNNPNKPQ